MDLKGKRIGILEYAHCCDSMQWTIRGLEKVWKEAGASVISYSDLSKTAPEVDLWFCHLDSTRTPASVQRFIRRQPRVVNGRLTDIRKSGFSDLILDPADDSYSGQVLVKSDYNFMGKVDKRLLASQSGWARYLPRSIRRRLMGYSANFKSVQGYEVYDSPADVPAEYMKDDQLVVEKFRPERDGDHYALRMMFKLGDRAISCRIVSTSKIVKNRNILSLEVIENDPRVIAWANAKHVDYGKIDYALNDGELVFYDINRTPGNRSARESDREKVAEILAPGILQFLE